jgi:glycosyltransferase involved in cell wall biosynthesis
VFGVPDESPDARSFDCHLLISKMSALRYRRRAGLDGRTFGRRHRVSYYPVEARRLRAAAPELAQAKQALGLDPGRPVVGRLGRADDRKWNTLVVDMIPRLLQLVPEAQMMLVGATPAVRRRLARHRVLDSVTEIEPVAGVDELARLYSACDVFVTGSAIGETFGLAIAEAMALGVPVVTSSTPWVDNAQVELVDEGSTGHVANHPQPFAEAVAALLRDDAHRQAIGAAARQKVDREFDAERLTRQLERLYAGLLAGNEIPEWSPGPEEVDAFTEEAFSRTRAQFRPLRPRERLEARAAVLAERGLWAARDLRSQPRVLARPLRAWLRSLRSRRRTGGAAAPR